MFDAGKGRLVAPLAAAGLRLMGDPYVRRRLKLFCRMARSVSQFKRQQNKFIVGHGEAHWQKFIRRGRAVAFAKSTNEVNLRVCYRKLVEQHVAVSEISDTASVFSREGVFFNIRRCCGVRAGLAFSRKRMGCEPLPLSWRQTDIALRQLAVKLQNRNV